MNMTFGIKQKSDLNMRISEYAKSFHHIPKASLENLKAIHTFVQIVSLIRSLKIGRIIVLKDNLIARFSPY